MAAPPGNRISSEELEEYSSWKIPEIDNPDRVLQSAEREDRLRREAAKRAENEVVGEEVEDVAPLTAEQIKAISENAYQEGFDEGNKAGFEKGHNEGYESGKQQALEEYRQILDNQSQQLGHLLTALMDPCESHTLQLQRIILDSVCKLTEAVVQRELQTETSHILELVKEAIDYLPTGAENVRLYLNPDDVALVEDYVVDRGADWKVIPDPELMPSGVRIETKQSVIDYSVESRLQNLCEQYVHGELTNDTEDEELEDTESRDELPNDAMLSDGMLSDEMLDTTAPALTASEEPTAKTGHHLAQEAKTDSVDKKAVNTRKENHLTSHKPESDNE